MILNLTHKANITTPKTQTVQKAYRAIKSHAKFLNNIYLGMLIEEKYTVTKKDLIQLLKFNSLIRNKKDICSPSKQCL